MTTRFFRTLSSRSKPAKTTTPRASTPTSSGSPQKSSRRDVQVPLCSPSEVEGAPIAMLDCPNKGKSSTMTPVCVRLQCRLRERSECRRCDLAEFQIEANHETAGELHTAGGDRNLFSVAAFGVACGPNSPRTFRRTRRGTRTKWRAAAPPCPKVYHIQFRHRVCPGGDPSPVGSAARMARGKSAKRL